MTETYLYGNTGSGNTQIGTDSLANLTTGVDNTAFGTNALQFLTTGDGNAAFGINAMSNASGNPSFSSAFGTEALKNIANSVGNSGFGYQSFLNVTTGENNSGFGASIAPTLVTGSSNALFGANVDVAAAGTSDSVGIGSGDIGVGSSTYCGTNNVVVGHGVRSRGSDSVKLGSGVLADETSSGTNLVIAGRDAGGDVAFSHFADIILGHNAFSNPNDDFSPSTSEGVIIGAFCCLNTSQSFSDTYIGYEACQNSSYGQLGVVLGTRANQLSLLPNVQSQDQTIIGYQAGINSTFDPNLPTAPVPSITLIGAFCGSGITAESYITSIGYQSMETCKGENNTAIGYRALHGPASYNTTNISAGTAVGAGKIASVATVLDGTISIGEVSDVDFTGATTAGLDGTYFLISSISRNYYVWFDVDNLSVDPAPGGTAIEVNLVSGDSDAVIADKARIAIGVFNDFDAVITTSAGVLESDNVVNGDVTDIAPGTAVGLFKLASVTKLADGTGGTPEMNRIDTIGARSEVLGGRYFLISTTTTDYYVWFSWSNNNTDPGPGGLNLPALVGKTGIKVSLSYTDTWVNATSRIISALNVSGVFSATYRSNVFLRIIASNSATDNVAVGNNAFSSVTTGSNNVALGSDSALTLEDGSGNVLIGKDVDSGLGTNNSTVVGGGASSTGDDSLVLGAGASSTAARGIAIGAGAIVTTADSCQLGPSAVSGTGKFRFKSQIISDEAWIGGGTSKMIIDDNGNICRTTLLENTGSTTDATPLNLVTYATSSDSALRLEIMVTGRRTGGTAGSVNDTASYYINALVKNDGGVMSTHIVNEIIVEDQPAWDATVVVSGTDAIIQVTGALNNNIDWNALIR